jgi:hypothetical protein
VGSAGGGVFKSLDGGEHWFAVNSGLSDLTVGGLAMDPANPAVLYACGPSGVFKTVTGAEAGVTIAVRDANEVATDTSIGWATAVTTDPAENVHFISSNTVFRIDPKGFLTRIEGILQTGTPATADRPSMLSYSLTTYPPAREDLCLACQAGLPLIRRAISTSLTADRGRSRLRRREHQGGFPPGTRPLYQAATVPHAAVRRAHGAERSEVIGSRAAVPDGLL